MVYKIMINNNRYYYLFDTYSTWNEASNVGRRNKKKNPALHWYIIKAETGGLFPRIEYHLYMDKTRNLLNLYYR